MLLKTYLCKHVDKNIYSSFLYNIDKRIGYYLNDYDEYCDYYFRLLTEMIMTVLKKYTKVYKENASTSKNKNVNKNTSENTSANANINLNKLHNVEYNIMKVYMCILSL